ncbi:hypothetical protein E8E13_002605 [Curvularia kusanoi]|uniref:Uncharacterized protein n=1 Tax=Curvularia kusanoi TaxID=90978 RepID=A0A9P4T3Q7_CURKU|nr:hypothetical protein E8E13_002605 [Curvularia kusanoi]
MGFSDRISRTSMGKYDQVIALSQVMLNEGLRTYWEKGAFEKKQEEMPESQSEDGAYQWGYGFSYSIMPNQYLANAIFGPPSIIMKPSSNDLSSIERPPTRRLHLGQTNQRTPSRKSTTTKVQYYSNYAIKDWKVSVPIKLALRPLSPKSPDYQAAQDLKQPGNHTLHQLMVDTSSIGWKDINIVDMGEWQEGDKLLYHKNEEEYTTSHPKKRVGEQRQFKDEPEMFRKGFEMYIKVCFEEFWRRGLNLFGTISKSSEVSSDPTFAITDVRHQTYPHYDRTTKTNAPHTLEDGELNYFLYLETVDNRAPPDADTADAVIAPGGGNFIDGVKFSESSNKGQFGTFMLSREVFLEGHILKKLEQFNRIMHLDIIKNEPVPDAKFLNWYCTFKYVVHLGHGWQNKNDTKKYEWTYGLPTINSKWEEQHEYISFSKAEEGALVWHNIDDEWNVNPVEKTDVGVEAWSWGSNVTIQRVVVIPGSDVIKLEGMTIAKFNYKVDPSIFLANWYGGFKLVAKWNVSLKMKTFVDGGIGIEVTENAPTFSYTNLCEKDRDDGAHNLTSFKKKLVSGYDMVKQNFSHVVHDLKNSLQGQDRLNLPSVGVYYFQNPLMNYHGDLGKVNPNETAERDTSAQPAAEPMEQIVYETTAQASEKDNTEKVKKADAEGEDRI